jgi:hypothetical protein
MTITIVDTVLTALSLGVQILAWRWPREPR